MFARRGEHSEGEGWLSVSDLMAGLMVFFLFIAILYIQPLQRIKLNVEAIVQAWQEGELEIYNALQAEFEDDLPRWNAQLDRNELTLRFNSPDVLFEAGDAALRPEFEVILSDFFPRYLATLEPFYEASLIEEIRIEGHTSSDWVGVSEGEAYFRNMELSQDRTRSVLQYALELDGSSSHVGWARPLLTANGLASSRPITDGDSSMEDPVRSRRVEFRVRTTTQNRLNEILEQFEAE
ncbi:OmpA/MotB family protein [Maricaulis sp.]|uniref:OmpA/MotB family protein n=1 Tax=Maricaulis sp. TaxID=1486257 RepID=UPI002B26FC81|nr:OmpA family protein [Maricaulis sp.]